MIHVIASIFVKQDRLAEFLANFKENIPAVREEQGCIEYEPTRDLPTGLALQELNGNVVTIVEKWACLEDLRAHLAAPHMLAYHNKVKDLVEKVVLKVLEKA